MSDVDAVVIGSGAGGLTAALALARAGQKVLVLEQHYLPGGWCHSFNLGGYRFSPGVHYIGECDDGGRMREIYEGLGVSEDLEFYELDPEGFDAIRVGDQAFEIPRGYDRLVARLKDRFPAEAAGIDRYMGVIRGLSSELDVASRIESPLEGLRTVPKLGTLARWGWRSLQTLQDTYLSDPLLKSMLSIQAGDHGMPASRCPAGMHAAVTGHYFEGAFYPKGGGRSLPRAFLRQLKKHGGQIRLRSQVDEILIEGGRAVGVRLSDGEEIRAKRVISNADPQVTFGRLVPEGSVPSRVRRKLDRARWSITAISVFMAADFDARGAGLTSANLWVARDAASVGGMYDYAVDPRPMHEQPVPGAFLTCTSLKDPSKNTRGVHTLEAFTFVSWEAFSNWQASQMGDRPEGYDPFKEALADRVLECLEPVVPGLSDALVFREVGTPLTNEYYCASTRGNLYGTEKSLRQLVPPANWGLKTPIRDLWLCGASTIGHGVAGATLSGIAVAREILGCRTAEILSAQGPSLPIRQAEPALENEARVA